MIALSPDYQLALDLIARLQTVDDISPLLLPDIWDASDQQDRITRAAAKFKGSIAVTPTGLVNEYAADKSLPTLRMQATVAVSVFATPNATRLPAGHETVASYLSGLVYAVIRELSRRPHPSQSIPYNQPVIVSVNDYDLSEQSGLKNLIGKAIILTAPVNITPNY